MQRAAKMPDHESRFQLRLKELEETGEATLERRTNFGPLPEIRLSKKVHLDRIIRNAKR